jgi:hypothetical protein
MEMNSKKPIRTGVFAVTLGVLAVGSLIGLRYLPENKTPEVTNNSDTQDDTSGLLPTIDNSTLDQTKSDTQNSVLSEKIVAKNLEQQTSSTAILGQSSSSAAANDTPAQNDNNQNNNAAATAMLVPQGYVIADFEDNLPVNWAASGNIQIPGCKSNAALKLSNATGESIAAKKVFETPILSGFNKIEFNLKTSQPLLGDDASALAFEQDGSWKLVSISDYIDNNSTEWQLVSIPLSDFAGLVTNKPVANMNFRFWNESAGDVLLDNIVLNGNSEFEIAKPTDLKAEIVTDKQITLSWTGTASSYNVYRDGVMLTNVTEPIFTVENLEPSTTYHFYVTAADSGLESMPTEMIEAKTLDPIVPKLNLGNFDDNTLSGWSNGTLISNSISTVLRLSTTPENDSTGTTKTFDLPIAKNHEYLEFDVNLNGNLFWDEDATVNFDQGGWKTVYLDKYVENGKDGMQHVKIPLTDFAGLKTDEAVAQLIFRFWNSDTANVDLDNIVVN